MRESRSHVPPNISSSSNRATSRDHDLESKIRKRWCSMHNRICVCVCVECFPWLNRRARDRSKFASRGRNNDRQVKVKKERDSGVLATGADLPSGWMEDKKGDKGSWKGHRARRRGSISLAYLVAAEISIAIDIGRLFENESVTTRFHEFPKGLRHDSRGFPLSTRPYSFLASSPPPPPLSSLNKDAPRAKHEPSSSLHKSNNILPFREIQPLFPPVEISLVVERSSQIEFPERA